jgi:hypothetical protein
VLFRITYHSGFSPPADALDLLMQKLGTERSKVSFSKSNSEIRASWNGYRASSTTPEEHGEIGRRAVLDIVREVCELTPGLQLDWFAVSRARDAA